MEKLNQIIREAFKLAPSDLNTKEMTSEMRKALAECYAQQGFRDYMDNAINRLIINSAEQTTTLEDLAARKGGIIFMKQMLMTCQKCYNDYTKSNNKSIS